MTLFYGLSLGVILILFILETLGMMGVYRFEKSLTKGSKEKISIIIPARNEEDNIARTLESIECQKDLNFELIVIVDRSQDCTLSIVETFAARTDIKVKVLVNDQEPPVGSNPKVFAVKKGVAQAEGSIYLFTDADCILPPKWIASYRKMFSKKNTGLVIGLLSVVTKKSLLSHFQNFEHIYRSFYALVCVGLGIPTGGFGNNLGIRKNCFEEAGGFNDLAYSVTEDAVLISCVGKSKTYKVRCINSSCAAVKTYPQKDIHSYLQQSLRWSSGALSSSDKKTSLLYLMLLGGYTLCNLAIPFSLLQPGLIALPLMLLLYAFLSALVAGIFQHANKKYWISFIPSLFLFLFFYQISFIYSLFKPQIVWKGSVIRTNLSI